MTYGSQGEYKMETAEQTAPTGNAVRQASLDLEKSMVEAADKAEATVQEINNITFSLEAGSGTFISFLIHRINRCSKMMMYYIMYFFLKDLKLTTPSDLERNFLKRWRSKISVILKMKQIVSYLKLSK